MNEATCPLHEVYAQALDFLASTHLLLVGPHCNKQYIWNMDQTPLWFSYHRSKTLAKWGTKTIHVCKTSGDTKRATAAITVLAAGECLKPMMIFKGQPRGRISRKELKTFNPSAFYACRKAAWMDETCMIRWIRLVLKDYLRVNPPLPGVVPLLILDEYRCHIMASVVQCIQKLGIEVIHIPGGCTGLCQPLDVGINKPFKCRMRQRWEEWMISGIKRTGTVESPLRVEVSAWVAEVSLEMRSLPMLKNT